MSSDGRVVHLKRDPYDVRIDRQTAWGNPFTIGRDGSRDDVIEEFRIWATTSESLIAKWIRENVQGLRGKTLGC